MKISPARTAAFDILLKIEADAGYSSALMPSFEEALSPADRGLSHQIVLGVLRRQMFLDRTIDTLARGRKLDPEVRIALRIALYQLKFLDRVPAYSAINESVNLVQRARKTSAKPFANAVLRRAAAAWPELEFADEIDRVSIETSHPRWLLEKWAGSFGADEAGQIAFANNDLPETSFRVVQSSPLVSELIERSTRSENVTGCYSANPAEPLVAELMSDGSIYVQDEGSQMVAAAIEVPDGGRFLDVCAAPGGKTGQIGKQLPDEKHIVAGDLHEHRLRYLRDNCRLQGVTADIVSYDAEQGLPFAQRAFDAVLVDAPCSGTGTIRRNPELRYLIGQRDLEALPGKQLRILSNASKLVSPGGTVVYSTCSLEREENESVAGAFLAANADFEKIEPRVPERFLTPEGFARTWPHRDAMDGFFIAAFRRRKTDG